LTIDPTYIQFDDNDLINKPQTRFKKDDIKGFRYGIKWIKGYQFTIGRIYCIDIQDKNDRIIKLRLKSLYGIRKNQLNDKYLEILENLYDNFFDEISLKYLSKFDENIDFELGGLIFSQKGILFNKQSEFVSWNNIETSSFMTYYSIYPKSNPHSYKVFEYLNDWNTGILYSVSRQILKNKGLFEG
jgi:hypothetical protein